MELISVIVPVYKVEKYLRKCVDSILAQTYTNLEIILVDDGSPDNCGKICDEYAEKDPRIKVIHQENGGVSAARNAGLDIASGDYIGFVDSDDYIAPDMYEKLYIALVTNKADMAICNYDSVDESGRSLNNEMPIHDSVLTGEQVLEYLQINNYGCFVSPCNKLYKSNLITSFFFPDGKINEDNLIAFEIVFKSNKIVLIEDAFYFYFQRTGSIMHSPISIERFSDFEAVMNKIEFYRINGLSSYILPSKLQLLRIYRFLRTGFIKVPEKDKVRINEYDRAAKEIYREIKHWCSWKDHLFFLDKRLYRFLFLIKSFFNIKYH